MKLIQTFMKHDEAYPNLYENLMNRLNSEQFMRIEQLEEENKRLRTIVAKAGLSTAEVDNMDAATQEKER